jgi:hypothetical protein
MEMVGLEMLMRLAGLLFILLGIALSAFSGILARQGVASQNAFWGTHWGDRAVRFNRIWTLVISIGAILFGTLLLLGVLG